MGHSCREIQAVQEARSLKLGPVILAGEIHLGIGRRKITEVPLGVSQVWERSHGAAHESVRREWGRDWNKSLEDLTSPWATRCRTGCPKYRGKMEEG